MNELFIAYDNFFNQYTNTIGSLPYAPPGSPVPAFRGPNPPKVSRQPAAPGNSLQRVSPLFPFIVYEPIQPGVFQNVVTYVSIWDRDLTAQGSPGRPNYYARVNDIAEQILDNIDPVLGVHLQVGGRGSLWVLRGGVPFQTAPTGEDDPTYVRGMLSLILRGHLF